MEAKGVETEEGGKRERENQLQYMQHRLTAVRIKMCPLDLEWGQG